jgi:hypothetical protein
MRTCRASTRFRFAEVDEVYFYLFLLPHVIAPNIKRAVPMGRPLSMLRTTYSRSERFQLIRSPSVVLLDEEEEEDDEPEPPLGDFSRSL